MSFYKNNLLNVLLFTGLVVVVNLLGSIDVQAQTHDKPVEAELAICEKSKHRLRDIAKNAREQLKACKGKEPSTPTTSCNDSNCEQRLANISQQTKLLQAQLASKEQILLRLKNIAKGARLQLKTCENKLKLCEDKPPSECPIPSSCNKDQQFVRLQQTVESLQTQLTSKEETLIAVTEIAKYTQEQFNFCDGKMKSLQTELDNCAGKLGSCNHKLETNTCPTCSNCNEEIQRIAELSKKLEDKCEQIPVIPPVSTGDCGGGKEREELRKKITGYETQVQKLTAKNNNLVEQQAGLKSELEESNNVIISLVIENLLAQNTCDDIRISIPNGEEIIITGVSSSRERIANLKKRAENHSYFSLGKFDVDYVDTNRCIIRLSDNWAIIAKENGEIEELDYSEGAKDYLRQLPSHRNCARIGEVLQNSDKGPRQFFGDGVQPQIWALKKGAVGICRGTEEGGLYEWSFKRGHDGYSALLVIKGKP